MREILMWSAKYALLIVIAVVLLINEQKIMVWERRTARRLLRWAYKRIPAFRDWLDSDDDIYGADKPIQPHIIRDWRNNV